MKPVSFVIRHSSSVIRHSRRRRQGVAVLVVMLLLAVTLGLSYAVVRSQATALQIQRNSDVRASARRASLVGLTMGLKKMHTSEWSSGQGLATTLEGSIGNCQSYQVTYTAGDPGLAPDDPDWPYRVTLLSVGRATDPADCGTGVTPGAPGLSTHRARAVVRLVPRSVPDQPGDWGTMQQYTVFQSEKERVELDIPCRLEGPVRVQGPLKIATHYPDDYTPWQRYLGDLNAMRLDGYADCRPFTGPVHLPFFEQDPRELFALIVKLAVTAVSKPVDEAASDWTQPGSFKDYRIYPGGPVYAVTRLGSTLENTTLEPDGSTNPLGLFYRDGSLTIRDNVTIRGSLFCKHDVRIEGANVHVEPVEVPGLLSQDGSEAPARLPLITCHKLSVKPTAGGSLTGLVAVFDEFEVEKSPDTLALAITGRLIASELSINERQPWETADWDHYYEQFEFQLGGGAGPVVPYFPVWMAARGYDPKPRITVKPDPTPVTYYWKKPYNPVYVPHPDDDGLRWDLLEWTENP